MAATLTTSVVELIPEITTEASFVAFENALMPALVRTENIPQGGGLTYEFPKWNELNASQVAETADITDQESTTSSVILTVADYGLMTTVSDKAQYSSQESVIAAQGRQHGMAIANQLDADLLALFASLGVTQGDGTGAMTAANIFEAVARLRALKLSATDIVAVVSPGVAYDLKSSMTNTFAGLDTDASNEIMRSSFVGSLAGIQVFESGNLVSTAGQSLGSVFHRASLGLVNQKPISIETERDASFRRTELVSTVSYAAGVIEPTYGIGMDYLSSIGV